MSIFVWPAVTLIVLSAGGSLLAQQDAHRYWAQWRGPLATGVAPHATPPLEWSETRNLRWKVEIPGRGSASPVVWNDRIFVLTAQPRGLSGDAAHRPLGGSGSPPEHDMKVIAIDRESGRTLWERTASTQVPHEGTHNENGTWASSSAATDGEHVIASFESRGLFVYDMQGTLVWQKDLGDKRMRSEFGEGSTPTLHGDRIVVVWDHQGQSFVVALDKRTGRELWRAERDEIDSWATPIVVEQAGRRQVITGGMNRIRSYDLETGTVVWESPGTTMNPIPSPVHWEGMVFVTSGFRGNNLKAIRLAGASGDLSKSGHIAWTLGRDTPYVPSPLVHDGILYILKSNDGLLSAFDARTGQPHYQLQRLRNLPNVFASPVAAQGRVYVVGRDGTTAVLKHGPAFELLAENALEDGFDASPALVGSDLYLRGYRYLYSIRGE
jgi:outer membrane protein assembly factor BamB